MNYKIKYKDEFVQKAKYIFGKKPELAEDYKIILALLSQNPFEHSLMLQPLYGELRGNYYLNLTAEIRLILSVVKFGKQVFLIDIGKMAEEEN